MVLPCQCFAASQTILSWTEDNAHTQTISWKGDNKTVGYVEYKKQYEGWSDGKRVRGTGFSTFKGKYYRNNVTIKGLSQKTTYDYRTGDGKTWSKTGSFTTGPMVRGERIDSENKMSHTEEGFSFAFLGDVQYEKEKVSDYNRWGKLVETMYQKNPEITFGLTGGDMVNSAKTLKEWEIFYENAALVFGEIPLMSTPGNHDKGSSPKTYVKMNELPSNGPKGLEEEFYSFDYANCHILSLNSCFFMDSRQKRMGKEKWKAERKKINNWIDEDLKSVDDKWKIVVMHHPAYGISDGNDIYKQIRKSWEARFELGEVDLVLCGHQHVYMRTKPIGGITYVMGNSGQKRSNYYKEGKVPGYVENVDALESSYQIVSVEKNQLKLASYNEKGQLIDKWDKKVGYSMTLKVALGAALLIGVLICGFAIRIFWWRKGTLPKSRCEHNSKKNG